MIYETREELKVSRIIQRDVPDIASPPPEIGPFDTVDKEGYVQKIVREMRMEDVLEPQKTIHQVGIQEGDKIKIRQTKERII